MIVVADTSPLNYLIRLGQANILQQLYGRVLVPRAVLEEMQHPGAPDEVRAWANAVPSWLEAIKPRQIDPTLRLELGAGEREAISLAIEVNADVLLIDEQAGRQEAEARHIEVAGTLAVLLQAALRGHLAFPESLEEIRAFGFRVSPSLAAATLARYEQLRKANS